MLTITFSLVVSASVAVAFSVAVAMVAALVALAIALIAAITPPLAMAAILIITHGDAGLRKSKQAVQAAKWC